MLDQDSVLLEYVRGRLQRLHMLEDAVRYFPDQLERMLAEGESVDEVAASMRERVDAILRYSA